MKARQAAVKFAVGELKAPVLMGARGRLRFNRETQTLMPTGWDFPVYDCSGLVAAAIKAGGGPDMTGTHNAQKLSDESRPLLETEHPDAGDLGFYGKDWKHVIHVVLFCAGGKVISADGATWGITTLEQAKASRCMVRLHEGPHFRGDYLGAKRPPWLDAVDLVSR